MSTFIHQVKTEVYEITKDNVDEKMSYHFGQIKRLIVVNELSNIKINTRIESTSINTDIIEMRLRGKL